MDNEIRREELSDEVLEKANGGEKYRDIICRDCGYVMKGWPPSAWKHKGCTNCGSMFGYYNEGLAQVLVTLWPEKY